MQRDLPDPPQDDTQPERPSLNINRARHSWRSGRSLAHDDRDDAKSYRAVSTHDYGAQSRPPATREYSNNPHHEHRSSTAREFSNPHHEHRSSTAKEYPPRHDPRSSYYDHPYYNHPYIHPYYGPPPSHPRDVPPRASWRSSATVGRSPSRASRVVPPPKGSAHEPSDDESEDEIPPAQPSPSRHQRPLTWGYDGNMTPPPVPQEVIMRLPFTEWMNSGLKERMCY